jgi:uncharacterized membrane protein YcaP (DUF421 family)
VFRKANHPVLTANLPGACARFHGDPEEGMDLLESALGLGRESQELGAPEMALRAVVVYVATVAIVRLGKKRFMGRATAFDVILGIMLGSIVSRAVTGNAPLGPALAAAAALMAMHWMFSGLALHWQGFGVLVKGRPRMIVKDGRRIDQELRAAHMTEHDLMEDLRSAGVDRVEDVREARLERKGAVSVLQSNH